ncbi:MAG TPA: prepilin-type N-terminal cleavage/methylation domain-containing protein [Candidatus Eremiobacteraceae bacterium]|nr:prepilin-type N-terminal cleavage/methylation domain-containing protein [Candidatus Eremiobacteraceae bacterium]
MLRIKNRLRTRGFTLVEMMFAMGILGLVLSLTLAEFITAFGHFSFAQTHMDAEMAGRVAMAKVNDVLQLASSDHNPADSRPVPFNTTSCSSKCAVVANPTVLGAGGSGPDVAIIATTTDPSDNLGQLSPTMKTVNQVPTADYQVVELSFDNVHQQIVETRTPFLTYIVSNGGTVGPSTIVARNVQNFNVTAINWDQSKAFCSGFQVNIQTVGPAQGGRPPTVANTSNTVYFTTYAGFQ